MVMKEVCELCNLLLMLHSEWGHSSYTSNKSWKRRDGFTVGESRSKFRCAKQGRYIAICSTNPIMINHNFFKHRMAFQQLLKQLTGVSLTSKCS